MLVGRNGLERRQNDGRTRERTHTKRNKKLEGRNSRRHNQAEKDSEERSDVEERHRTEKIQMTTEGEGGDEAGSSQQQEQK
jgi:hypothetical protein